uniref:Uncharacterized protein n=1 Tax=blood disease bacterium R229 TaxID=741978 RepID=G2ZY07_9RALS|nr:hypothetical protein BDB_mp80114 [blood disease bacterium R229]
MGTVRGGVAEILGCIGDARGLSACALARERRGCRMRSSTPRERGCRAGPSRIGVAYGGVGASLRVSADDVREVRKGFKERRMLDMSVRLSCARSCRASRLLLLEETDGLKNGCPRIAGGVFRGIRKISHRRL